MNDIESQEIIRMVESNWHFDLGTARAMWRTELLMWDPETAIRALSLLGRKQSYKIVLADLVETMEMIARKKQEKAREEANRQAERRGLTDARRFARPEWTFVWAWSRFYRDPRETRYFPQQEAPPTESMTTADYDALRAEWIDAGSPRLSVREREMVQSP
jgi:hypothetical protein